MFDYILEIFRLPKVFKNVKITVISTLFSKIKSFDLELVFNPHIHLLCRKR